MMEGLVVLVAPSGQAGTVVSVNGESIWVLLRNGELWVGPSSMIREPQSDEDLAAAPVEVSRPEPKRKRRRNQ